MINLCIANLISFLLLSYLGESLLENRFRNKKNLLISYIFCVLVLTIINGDNKVTLLNTLLLTVGYIFFMIFNYKSSAAKITIVLSSFMICNSIAEILSATFLNLFTDLNSFSNRSTLQFTLAVLLAGTITFLLSSVLIKIIKFSYWHKLPKYTYLMTVLPITTMVLIININDYFYLLRNHQVIIFILLGLLVSNFIILFIFLKTINYLEIQKELEVTKAEKQYSDLKYQILDQQFKTNFTFMHDTIRSLMKIEGLIGSDTEEFKSELNNLNKRMLRGLNIINSNSSVISPIINFRLKDMLNNNIDFKSVIEFTDFYFIDIYDLRCIFDTLLDIGILHCVQSKTNKNLLILKTKQIDQQIAIQLLYSCGNSLTSKECSESLSKLSAIVAKNNGILSTEPVNDDVDTNSLVIIFNPLFSKEASDSKQ